MLTTPDSLTLFGCAFLIYLGLAFISFSIDKVARLLDEIKQKLNNKP